MTGDRSLKEAFAALVAGRPVDPFALLGPTAVEDGIVIRAFVPGATALDVIDRGGGEVLGTLDQIDPAGIFEGAFAGRPVELAYRIRCRRGDDCWDIEDPYRFGPVIGELDNYLLGEGTHQRLWERLGAHAIDHQGVAGTHFAVWAPNAQRVSVVGDFNRWDGRCHPMHLHPESGVWELFLPGVGDGAIYKFELLGPGKRLLPLKADPFAFGAERRPDTGSVVRDINGFTWRDQSWMDRRAAANDRAAPISIYEVHLGSWRRGAEGGYLTYAEIADQLIAYVQEMGFSHIELLPISEHPFDGSWGYQPIGLYAPTSRFGKPADFQQFVERCHQAGIGLLLDWVPGHFPSDRHGLARFDGRHLFEHADPRQGFHRDWNTLIFNYGRAEVRNYLLSNALFWLEHYHLDGLRVDAVASMLYLDYSREAGGWIPNKHGGNENLEAIDFLKRMNELVYGETAGAMTVAEESTAWPGVSLPTDQGGLGFGYKWNMGWMNDTLAYMREDPIHRRFHHQKMTFGLHYAFSENFVLPLSHDEVVHGKGSILARMPGDIWHKFANIRAYYTFMWTHPGKKLLFMGAEFAQKAEWNADKSLDWHLLGDDLHQGVQRLVRDLNHLYRDLPALHELDCEVEGFEWLEADAAEESVLAYLRLGREGANPVVVVLNFTPIARHNYRIGVPEPGRWIERLNSDAGDYQGGGIGNLGAVESEPIPVKSRPDSIAVTLPPLAGLIFEPAR